MKPNDVILHTVTKVAVVIIFAFAIYLYYGGHHNPGGGFIGGLSIASGITLLFLAFDIETIRKSIPFDFKNVAALGVLIAILTGMGSFLFDVPFLTQTFGYFDIPIFWGNRVSDCSYFRYRCCPCCYRNGCYDHSNDK